MGGATGIEWAEATWNPWRGCDKVSPGCARCYMYREQRRYGRDPEVVVRSASTFDAPRRWTEGRRIFTCSWSDWFHPTADPWREAAWRIIRETPRHTYLILTKRPERMLDHLPWGPYDDPWPNVCLGVSVENQRFSYRADLLATIPAALRFISAEPLLGPVTLSPGTLRQLRWIIVGGESGPKARPMDLTWARALWAQCQASGVAFFLKQLGGWPNKRGGEEALLDGRTWTETPWDAAPEAAR